MRTKYANERVFPGENADFGDPELINLFLGGIFGRPGRAYSGKGFFGDFVFPVSF